jgi:hypothetical protein
VSILASVMGVLLHILLLSSVFFEQEPQSEGPVQGDD